jgi:nitroreductase
MPDQSFDDRQAPELADLALALIQSRHSVAPKRLVAPGPTLAQLQHFAEAAACAPDHRGLRPWRLLRIADHQRAQLADVFEACTRDRLASPGPDDIERSRAKAFRAPTLLLAVLRLSPTDPDVPDTERAVALGAALMNLLLAAHGQGFGAMLTSGHAVRTARFAQALQVAGDERAVCFVSIGTPTELRRKARASAHELLSDWQPSADEPALGSASDPCT